MPKIARRFKDSNPEVEFSLLAIPTAHQLQMLQTGSLDIGFLRLPIGEQRALEVVTVHREPFVFVVLLPTNWQKEKRVRLREVPGENFVMNERSHSAGFHDLIFGMLRDATKRSNRNCLSPFRLPLLTRD